MLLAGKVAVVTINTQENPNLGGRFGVRGIPAIILFRRGKMVDQTAGAQTPEAVIAWVQRNER
jgi:thioredoxin 2